MSRRPALVCALLLSLLAPAAAHASSGSGPAALVTIGDSYISGEAGRWAGNSTSPTPGNDGTDRACQPAGLSCSVDKSRVYVGGTAANGCHRSDVAEVLSADVPVTDRINLACSGAVTKNVFRASSGGTGQNGEPPQADQLLAVAKSHDVKMIIVSIGGNDLGFAGIVAACLQAYVTRSGPCEPAQQPKIAAAMPKVVIDVEKAIDEIRAVMTEDGYAQTDYRLVLQTYPSVIPRAAENRYAESDPQRTTDGCPTYDSDANWARDTASPEIGDTVKAAATARGTEILDLRDTFQGHEFCAKTTSEATPFSFPSPAASEWGRFLGASTVQEGDLQEAFHPNAYGQMAFGACVTQLYAQAPGTFACTGRAGIAPAAVVLTRTGTLPTAAPVATAKPKLSLHVGAIRRAAGGRTCVAFLVRVGGKPQAAVNVRLGGVLGRTASTGRVTICKRFQPGTKTAKATRTRYRSATAPVRIPRR